MITLFDPFWDIFLCFSQLPTLVYTFIRIVSWRRQWQPTPVLLPGKAHGQRSLVGCSPWGWWESDTTERLHFHFSLSCIGEGNGNPLPVFLPGESQGRRSLLGCHLWGRTESDTTEVTAAAAAAELSLYLSVFLFYFFILFFILWKCMWETCEIQNKVT